MSDSNTASPRDYFASVKATTLTGPAKPQGGGVSLIRFAVLCLRLRPDAPFPSQVRREMMGLRVVKDCAKTVRQA